MLGYINEWDTKRHFVFGRLKRGKQFYVNGAKTMVCDKVKRELTCVSCPRGCTITVELDGGAIISLDGYRCPRGEAYARQEILDPRRIVTALVPVAGSVTPLSVKTSAPVPRDRISDCLEAIRSAVVQGPVQIGDVIVANVLGLGVDVVATRPLD